MAKRTLNAPLTARILLFDDGRDGTTPAEAVGRAIKEDGTAHSALRTVRHLSTAALGTVDREVGTMAEGLLDLDLGDVLLAAWRTYSTLIASARRTLAAPGSEEVLSLVSHRATSRYSPHIDLLVDGDKVHTFEFELQILFDLTGLAAVVSAGDLVALRGGDCLVTATLSLDGAQLAKRQRHVDLAVMVRLHPPVALVEKHVSAPSLRSDTIPDDSQEREP